MLGKKWIFIALIICSGSQLIYAQQFEMIWDRTARTYVVYEPNNLVPNSDGYPLVVLLHGEGNDANEIIDYTDIASKADAEHFIVVSPNALIYDETSYWNAGGQYETITNGADDVGFISTLIDWMIIHYNIDPGRIYLMGYSNGSAMAYRLASELSFKVSAIAANSGQMVFEYCDPLIPVPIIHIHGLNDSVCPYEGKDVNDPVAMPAVEDVIEIWRGINSCASTPDTVYDANGILAKKWNSTTGSADVVLYTIDGWGHDWPDTETAGISATDIMWDFLKDQQREIESKLELKQITHDDILRSYVVYEPNNLDPNKPGGYPLIVGLHGGGSNGPQFIATAFLIQKAIKEKFIIACPDALIHDYLTFWNCGGQMEEKTRGTDDVGFVSAVIDAMIDEYNIDPTRVYTMAHSSGSMMSYRLAAQLSHKIAAIATNSGQMLLEYENCNPEFPVPIIHFHGMLDEKCPYYGGIGAGGKYFPPVEEVLTFWSQINNCYSNPYTIYDVNETLGRKWASLDGNSDIVLYATKRWGHKWQRAGAPGIDATSVMWDFLEEQRRVIEIDCNEWYVTTDGTFSGDGSAENPWNLETALSRLSIKPGDIVWLTGGTYTGPFVKNWKPAGTEFEPIIYRAIPGEHVTIVSNDPNKPALTNKADNVWFWGIEITGENILETTEAPVSAIEQDSVNGAKYINMVVHDWPNGSGFDVGPGGAELYGCISYNNGKSGYTGLNCPKDVNDSVADLTWLRYYDCIAFGNSENGFTHDSNSQQLANILHRGCAAYNNGRTSEWTGDACNFYMGGDLYDEHLVMQDCFTYFPDDPFTNSTAAWGMTALPLDGLVTIEDNVFVGGGKGVTINGWGQVNFTGNTCYTTEGEVLDIGITGALLNCTFNYNNYYKDSDQFLYKQGTHYETLEAWQAATGWDANSIQISGQPDTPWIYLRENRYEPDRAHLVIYNWPETDTVTVDMNDLWPDGEELQEGQQYQYRIVNVEDIWSEPAAEGTLSDCTIEVPVQGFYAPQFTCYLVTREVAISELD